MTKTYTIPKLVAKGNTVELTRGVDFGYTDPDEKTARMPFGSVGFGL
jgi:hypothetical protein